MISVRKFFSTAIASAGLVNYFYKNNPSSCKCYYLTNEIAYLFINLIEYLFVSILHVFNVFIFCFI